MSFANYEANGNEHMLDLPTILHLSYEKWMQRENRRCRKLKLSSFKNKLKRPSFVICKH